MHLLTRNTEAGRAWLPAVISALVVVVALGIPILIGSSYTVYVLGSIAIFALAAVGQGWLMGRTGQLSLGGGALFAVGGFSAALVSSAHVQFLSAFPVPLIAAAGAGAVAGLIVAIPGLRFKGVYLVLATLSLQYIVQFIGLRIQNTPEYLSGVPTTVTAGAKLVAPGRAIDWTALVILAAVMIGLGRLYTSQVGREWSAIAENETRASAMGINVRARKVAAFVGSSAVTALAGGMFAYYIGIVSYTTYTLTLALQIIVMVFIGGATTTVGPVIGAVVVTYLPIVLKDTVGSAIGGQWYTTNGPFVDSILYGVVLVLILLYGRSGIAGVTRRATQWVTRRSAPRRRSEEVEVSLGPPRLRRGVELGDSFEEDLSPAHEPEQSRMKAERGAEVVLRAERLSVAYQGTGVAVDQVSFAVMRGEVFGILGRNGAGKSSILKSIAGFPSTERGVVGGRVLLADASIERMSVGRRAAAGVILVPEQHKVFGDLTVREHFALTGVRDDDLVQLLSQTGLQMLEKRLDTRAGLLSGGEAQFLALGTAALRRPRVLLIDEMSLGLAPVAIAQVTGGLMQIKETLGCSIILVEQNARVAATVCDRIAILEHGQITWQGRPTELPADRLETSYFGSAKEKVVDIA